MSSTFEFPIREEDARILARNRLAELRHLLETAEQRMADDPPISLFHIEADFQIMGGLCDTAASQLLRVLEAIGAMADAGHATIGSRARVPEEDISS
jgi:hypothetical protein